MFYLDKRLIKCRNSIRRCCVYLHLNKDFLRPKLQTPGSKINPISPLPGLLLEFTVEDKNKILIEPG